MASTAPLSEFNRDQTSVIEELSRTGEPLYLTRNGRNCIVATGGLPDISAQRVPPISALPSMLWRRAGS